MTFTVESTRRFEREFKKLDRYTQRIVKGWIDKHLDGCENPRAFGKGLSANLAGLWRYRIGDCRLICEIEDQSLVILALSIGHRREIYIEKQ